MLSFIGVPPGTSWRAFLEVVAKAFLVAAALVAVGYVLSLWTPLAIGRQMLEAAADAQQDQLTWFVRRISGLGNVWVVGAACVIAGTWLHVRRSPIAGEVRLLLIGTFGGALVITAPLKLITDRSRPGEALVGTLTSAFPSGHALRTAAVYGLVIWLVNRRVVDSARRRLAILALLTVIAAIASARVYLWVHWPSDVGVGLLLGGVWLVALLRLTEPLRPSDGSGSVESARGSERSGQ